MRTLKKDTQHFNIKARPFSCWLSSSLSLWSPCGRNFHLAASSSSVWSPPSAPDPSSSVWAETQHASTSSLTYWHHVLHPKLYFPLFIFNTLLHIYVFMCFIWSACFHILLITTWSLITLILCWWISPLGINKVSLCFDLPSRVICLFCFCIILKRSNMVHLLQELFHHSRVIQVHRGALFLQSQFYHLLCCRCCEKIISLYIIDNPQNFIRLNNDRENVMFPFRARPILDVLHVLHISLYMCVFYNPKWH